MKHRIMKRYLTLFLFIVCCSAKAVSQNVTTGNAGPGYEALNAAISGYDYQKAISITDTLIAEITDTLDKSRKRELVSAKVFCLKKLMRFDEAIAELMKIMDSSIPDPGLMAEIADCHLMNRDYAKAMDMYYMLTVLVPSNSYFRIQLAYMMYYNGLYQDCIASCKSLLAGTVSLPVLNLMADSYNMSGEKDSAMLYYRKSLEMSPSSPKIVEKLSGILLGRKQYDEVISLTDLYLKDNPADMLVNPLYGLALHLKGEYSKSADVFEKQLELGDESYPTYFYLGLNRLMLKENEAAEKAFSMAYKADSTNVEGIYHYANTRNMRFKSRDSLSIALFRKAIDLSMPDSTMMSSFHYGYATSLLKAGDLPEAIDSYRKAYCMRTADISCLSYIGYCYEQMKDWKNALRYYEMYLKKGKEGTEMYNFVQASVKYIKGELFMEKE